MKHIKYIMISCLCAIVLLSCSDKNSDSEEFVNWQEVNDAYFAQAYQQARDSMSAGNTNWYVIKSFSKDSQISADKQDFIVARRITTSSNTESPEYLDSVKVNYRAYLIPSASYSGTVYGKSVGKIVDTSWYGDNLDLTTSVPKTLYVSSSVMVSGFITAMLHMHIGDRWFIIVPSKLAYWYSGSGENVPPYSCMLFDVHLQGFKRR